MKSNTSLFFLAVVLSLSLGDVSAHPGRVVNRMEMLHQRAFHTINALPDGTFVLIGGGGYIGITIPSEAEVYNPSNNRMEATGPMVVPRTLHDSVLLPNGNIFVSGGLGRDGQAVVTNEVYNPQTRTFSPAGCLVSGHWPAKTTLLRDGTILVTGGVSAERIDPVSGGSFEIPQIYSRYFHTATLLRDGRVLVSGGTTAGNIPAEIFSPDEQSFSATGVPKTLRILAEGSLLPNGEVIICGNALYFNDASAEVYNPQSGEFRLVNPSGSSRLFGTSAQSPGALPIYLGGLGPALLNTSIETFRPDRDGFSPLAAKELTSYIGKATALPDGRFAVSQGAQLLPWSKSYVEIYDSSLSNNSLTIGPPMTVGGIIVNNAVRLPNGDVLFVHGNAPAELFESATRKFTPLPPLETPRVNPAVAAIPNGQVLVFGGADQSGNSSQIDLFDPIARTFTPIGRMLQGRHLHTATTLKNGNILIAGGDVNGSGAEIFDTRRRTSLPLPPMSSGRMWHTATLLVDGSVLLAGGTDSDGLRINATAEIFNPLLNTFTPVGSMICGRFAGTATPLPNGQVLVAGGSSGGYPFEASVELFDPVSRSFSSAGQMYSSRALFNATLLPSGNVLFAGGYGEFLGATPVIEIYNPVTRLSTPVGNMISGRLGPWGITLGSSSILIAAGVGDLSHDGAVMPTDIYTPGKEGDFEVTLGISVKHKVGNENLSYNLDRTLGIPDPASLRQLLYFDYERNENLKSAVGHSHVDALFSMGRPPSPKVTIQASDPDASEIDHEPGAFVLKRNGNLGQELAVSVQFDGTARNGADYDLLPSVYYFGKGIDTVSINVMPKGDYLEEGDESITGRIRAETTSFDTVAGLSEATITLHDRPRPKPVVTVAFSTNVITENSGYAFATFRRNESDLEDSLTISIHTEGSANANQDYGRPYPYIMFPAGESEAHSFIQSIDDYDHEENETVTLVVEPAKDYIVGNPGNATVTILDDDPNPVLYYALNDNQSTTNGDTVVDQSGNGHNGSLFSVQVNSEGNHGSWDFRDSGMVSTAGFPELCSSNLALLFWIRPDDLRYSGRIAFLTGSDESWRLEILQGQILLTIQTRAASGEVDPTVVTTRQMFTDADSGQWHFIAVSIEDVGTAKRVRFYVDGGLIDETESSFDMPRFVEQPLWLQAFAVLDEFRIFSQSVSPEFIQRTFNHEVSFYPRIKPLDSIVNVSLEGSPLKEGRNRAQVILQRSGDVSKGGSIKIAVNGFEIADDLRLLDASLNPLSMGPGGVDVTFEAQEQQKTLFIEAIDDTLSEFTERFFLHLSNGTDIAAGYSYAFGEILDNDRPGLILGQPLPPSTTETGPESFPPRSPSTEFFVITRRGDLDIPLRFRFRFSGTATLGSDYTGFAGTGFGEDRHLTNLDSTEMSDFFEAGVSDYGLELQILRDSEEEPDETLHFEVLESPDYDRLDPFETEMTILDNTP